MNASTPIHPVTNPMPVVVLLSGRGSNFLALLDAQRQSRLPIRIVAVLSNRPDAQGLHAAREAGLPIRVLPHKKFPGRVAFDAALMEAIDEFHPELVILAGFMRILTPGFVARYAGRMLNIHPSLLPDLPGLDTHQRALDAGLKEHGASVHFVTAEVDGGPVVAQARVPVQTGDTAQDLAARVLRQEHRLFPMVVTWFAQGRLRWTPTGPTLDGAPLAAPLTLDRDVAPEWDERRYTQMKGH